MQEIEDIDVIPDESKEERFIRIATFRVNRLKKLIKQLSNCSNTSNYSYKKEQIDKMFASLRESLDESEAKFNKFSDSITDFSFM